MKEQVSKHIAEPIAITGACGFIGSWLINQLLDNGQQQIIAFDLPGSKIPAHWQDSVAIEYGDITNRAQVEKALASARTIFHLAAVVGDWGPAELFWDIAVEGSRNIFDMALKNSARVVLASSIVVYGDKIGRQVCREDDSYGRPCGIYSRCKQAQEELAWEYHRNKKMALSVVRPANVYGPGSKPWVHDVVGVLRTGMPSLINGGDFNAGLVYIENLTELFILAAAHPKSAGRIYNACDEAEITWQQYFSDLARIAGAPAPKSLPAFIARTGAFCCEKIWKLLQIRNRPPLTRESLNLVGSHHQISISKAKEELGYLPRVAYADGIVAIEQYLHALEQR